MLAVSYFFRSHFFSSFQLSPISGTVVRFLRCYAVRIHAILVAITFAFLTNRTRKGKDNFRASAKEFAMQFVRQKDKNLTLMITPWVFMHLQEIWSCRKQSMKWNLMLQRTFSWGKNQIKNVVDDLKLKLRSLMLFQIYVVFSNIDGRICISETVINFILICRFIH